MILEVSCLERHMLRKFFVLFSFIIFSLTSVLGEELDESLTEDLALTKSRLLVQKGEKAENKLNYDEAVECYETAIEVCPNNIYPLIKLGHVFAKTGMHREAERRLKQVPLDRLNPNGQSEVLTELGQMAVYRKSYGEAADSFRKALSVLPENTSARIRLAMMNLMNGMTSRAEELLKNETDFENYDPSDLRLALALDLYSCNFSRAYHTAGLIGKTYIEANPKTGFIGLLQMQAFFLFTSFLPLFLSKGVAIGYFILLFVALGVVASKLGSRTSLWHVMTFVFIGVSLLYLCQVNCVADVYQALLMPDYDYFGEVWILPRLLMASHLVALSLFFIFPIFRMLPEKLRPVSYELLGIWLFCFFFSFFVLSFQNRCTGTLRVTYLLTSILCSMLSSLIMPLGRYLLYKIGEFIGLSDLGKVGDKISKGQVSYTDTKILESQCWAAIDSGDINKAVMIARKGITSESRKDFPNFWLAQIAALIWREDLNEASKSIESFSNVFQNTDYYEKCLVYEALLKTEKDDCPIAYKLVNSIPGEKTKKFSRDELSISLLVLARCCVNVKDFVQARQNLEKAIVSAKSQIIKLICFVELAELDYSMNSKTAMQKNKVSINAMNCNHKNASYKNIFLSMLASVDGRISDALKYASDSLKVDVRNGKAYAWYGHLLCLQKRFSEAEELLGKMTPETVYAHKLMSEVTATVA